MISSKRIKEIIREATATSTGSRGSYFGPLVKGIRKFKNSENGPYNIQVSKYDSPELEYDSYDGKMDTPKNKIKKIENTAKKITNYMKNHPDVFTSDDDGNNINPTPGKNKKIVPINEANSAVTAGEFNAPFTLGLKKWPKTSLSPFDYEVDHHTNHHAKKTNVKNNKKSDKYYKGFEFFKKLKDETHPVHTISEDLAVWFGKKKKPKGSSQPKGPWVDICRKVDGKHPPCGRKDADTGSYPKCRAAGVAGKMSPSQKKAACQQKRKAEKNDPQRGKGQKPVMTSYKTKKESIDSLVGRIISEIRNSF
jgi:hypothetical protein